MRIFGEKCVRCGKNRTMIETEGIPTCHECSMKIMVKHEKSRKCPFDNQIMNKQIVRNLIIDICPECSGVWFDKKEVNLIRKIVENLIKEKELPRLIYIFSIYQVY